jgi:hypothetical protein
MLQQNSQKPVPPAKPPISAKPKTSQKTKFIIVGKNENQLQATVATKNGKQSVDHQPSLPASKQENHITLPSSPPNYSDCASDCCGILNSKQIECIQRQKNGKNGAHSNGAMEETNGSGYHQSHKVSLDKNMKTSSFDSLSSSSGGFKDSEYVTKTRVAYESYDKEDNCIANTQANEHESAFQAPVGHSKVQEMKTKLLAQQQKLLQQNHTNAEPSIAINRQQYQKSSQELEKVLGLRIERRDSFRQKPSGDNHDKLVKRLSKSFDDAQENNVAAISSQIGANISKQIQQKLTEEMKQQCEIIKEKFLIEKIPAQQHYISYTVGDGPSNNF